MRKPNKGLVVDGATSGNPGPSEYKVVDLESNRELKKVYVGVATNNLAEIFALMNGVMIAKQFGYKDVYTDSTTAMSWLKKKKINSSFTKTKMENRTEKLVNRCEELFKEINVHQPCSNIVIADGVTIRMWKTKLWGENPADFGRKY